MVRTCSEPSDFLASFTFPILPAPMVFPRIHVPLDPWIDVFLGRCDDV